MKKILVGHDVLFGPWLMHIIGSQWVAGKGSTIGLWDDVKCVPVAACFYESFNGASILVHLAGVGREWLNREFLWFSFYYPFEQLQARKVIALVSSDNRDSIRFTEHIGFHLEATLKDATPKGDMLIYTMTKDQCRWLSLRDKYRGQTISAGPA